MGVSLCSACRLIMLSTWSTSLKSASTVLARTVSTSHVVSQQTMVAHTQEGEEMVAHRPAATQMNNMMDIGSRRIFTPRAGHVQGVRQEVHEGGVGTPAGQVRGDGRTHEGSLACHGGAGIAGHLNPSRGWRSWGNIHRRDDCLRGDV